MATNDNDTTTTPKKKVSSRAEAGLVEEDFEEQPQDEAISDGEFLDWENQGDVLIETPQSGTVVSGMSEEEQSMDLTPAVVGPPAYGSPDPVTSAGRLLPLSQHPFNPNNLPEDHPARTSDDYGQGYDASIAAADLGFSFPGTSGRTDLQNDREGTPQGGEEGATAAQGQAASDYNAQTRADLLTEAESRGLTGLSNATKAEIIDALLADDAAA